MRKKIQLGLISVVIITVLAYFAFSSLILGPETWYPVSNNVISGNSTYLNATLNTNGTHLNHVTTVNFTWSNVSGEILNYSITNTSVNQSSFNYTSFNTTLLADGFYNLSIYVTNYTNSTNSTSNISLNVLVDNTPPTVTFTTPSNLANYSTETQDFNVTVTDYNTTSVSTVIVEFSNSSFTAFNVTATNNSGNWSASLNLSSLVEGATTVKVYSNDTQNNRNDTETITINVVRTAPTITITSPQNNSVVNGTTAINASIFSNVSLHVETVTFLFSNGSFPFNQTITTNNSGNWSYRLDTLRLGEGNSTLTVYADDFSGNRNRTGVNIGLTVDNSAPTGVYTKLTNGGYYNASTFPGGNTSAGSFNITLDGSYWPINHSTISVNISNSNIVTGLLLLTNNSQNVTCTPGNSGGTPSTLVECQINLTSLSNITDAPSMSVNVTVNDTNRLGGLGLMNYTGIFLNFTYDTGIPNITQEYPSNNSWVNTLTPFLNFTYADASPSATCVVKIAGTSYSRTATNNSVYPLGVDSGAGLANGETYFWNVTCTDLSGNSNDSKTWQIRTDNVKPSTTTAFNNSVATAGVNWVNTPVNVTVTATDGSSGVNYTEWLNASGTWKQANESFNVDKNLTGNVIQYRSVDNAGNVEVTRSKTIYFDGTAPTDPTFTFSSMVGNLTILAPNESLGVEVTSTDPLSGLASTATAYLHNGTNDSISSTTLTLKNGKYVGTIEMPETEHFYNFTVVVSDIVGNSVKANATVPINVSNGYPTITANVSNGSNVLNNSVVSITLGGASVQGWYNFTGFTGADNLNFTGTNVNIPLNSTVAETFEINLSANTSYGRVNYTLTYFVDVKGPEATLSGVSSNNTINSTQTFSATAPDAGIGTKNVTWTITKVGSSTSFKKYTDTVSPYSFTFDTMSTTDGNYSVNVTSYDYFGNVNISNNHVYINNSNISVSLTTDVSGQADFTGTLFANLIESITGLNSSISVYVNPISTNVLTRVPSTSSQLSDLIYVLNITADTEGTARIYFRIPTTTFANLGMTTSTGNLGVYADHGNAIVSIGTATFVDVVPAADGTAYNRYYFETSQFSTFFIGKTPSTTTTTTTTTTTSGGGSGGGSSTSSKAGEYTQQVWDLINAGERVTMVVENGALGVSEVSFKVNKDVYGGWVKANIRYDFPATVGYFAKGVYKKFEIIEGASLTPEIVEDAKIVFKVAKSWLAEHNDLASNRIKLYRWTEQWDELPTEELGEEGDYIAYEASSPGFSFFIIGVTDEVVAEPSTPEVVEPEVTVSEPEAKGMNAGLLVGLIIGGLVVLGLIVALVVSVVRRRAEQPKPRKR